MDMDTYIDAEDDVFFMDIKRRILLLMTDDEDGGLETKRQDSSQGHERVPLSVKLDYFSFTPNKAITNFPFPQSLLAKQPNWVGLPRGSNGTGVFIPHHPPISRRKVEAGNTNQERQFFRGRRLQRETAVYPALNSSTWPA